MSLDGRAVCGIGAEINVNHVSALALDLAGEVVAEHRQPLHDDRLGADEVIDRLVQLVTRTEADVAAARRRTGRCHRRCGRTGRPVARPAHRGPQPRLGRTCPSVTSSADRLDRAYPVTFDNEGNLAAIAEAVPGDPERQDMLVIFGEVGVGGGIVADGRLLRGRHGFAGEFGHMIVEPQGRLCGCGRVGCWETVFGLRALLDAAADPDDPVRDPELGLQERLAEINRRADLGDARTLAALRAGRRLGRGRCRRADQRTEPRR